MDADIPAKTRLDLPPAGGGDVFHSATPADENHFVTQLLVELRGGDEAAFDKLLPVVYEELRQIARRQLRREAVGHTLSATALVHESWLKLAGRAALDWHDRVHFFRVAARAMRQVLVNHAQKHATAKRGSGWERVTLDEAAAAVEMESEMLLALDEALTRLRSISERLSQVVEYRFFGGMTEEEVAAALGLSPRTVRRDWLKARLWLYTELQQDAPTPHDGTSS